MCSTQRLRLLNLWLRRTVCERITQQVRRCARNIIEAAAIWPESHWYRDGMGVLACGLSLIVDLPVAVGQDQVNEGI
jgi:hypothetical protein